MALQNQLDSLEQRLGQLLTVMDNMAAENTQLLNRQQELTAECLRLQQKNAAASTQIETIIAQLKQRNDDSHSPDDQQEA